MRYTVAVDVPIGSATVETLSGFYSSRCELSTAEFQRNPLRSVPRGDRASLAFLSRAAVVPIGYCISSFQVDCYFMQRLCSALNGSIEFDWVLRHADQ